MITEEITVSLRRLEYKMLATLTNVSGSIVNSQDVHDGGSGAVGGQRLIPLPFPFRHIGALADEGVKVLPMNSRDLRYKDVPWLTHEPVDEWNALVHKGIVTLAFASQTGVRDQEELAKNTL